jgi:hypothetical protein
LFLRREEKRRRNGDEGKNVYKAGLRPRLIPYGYARTLMGCLLGFRLSSLTFYRAAKAWLVWTSGCASGHRAESKVVVVSIRRCRILSCGLAHGTEPLRILTVRLEFTNLGGVEVEDLGGSPRTVLCCDFAGLGV